jgi:TonB-dependent receptor
MKSSSRLSRVLLGTTALTAALSFTAAHAQDTSSTATTAKKDDSTVVVVTGIRSALQSAAQIKRKATTFVDSITASDVSALPDLSVAEALARVPGVTVTRFSIGGSPDFPSPEGRGNLIRGLGFVRSEFNGRDAFSANGGRSLDWSSIPPQLVGAVDVFKNSEADLVEGGISGTINLRTLEPFDRKGFFLALSTDWNYGDLGKKWSPSYNAVIGNRWQTSHGEFGLMGSLSTSNLKSAYNGWQQPAPIPRSTGVDSSGNPIQLTSGTPYTGSAPIVGNIEGFQLRTSDINRDRSSGYLAAQWRNDNTRITGKYIKVINKTESLEHTLESFPDGANNQHYTVTNATYDNRNPSALNLCNVPNGQPNDYCEYTFPVTGGLMTSGTVTNGDDGWIGAYGLGPQVLGIGKSETTVTEDYSLNVKWRPADRWFVEFDAQNTKASAHSNETWGGSQTWAVANIVPGLDHPQVTLTPDPRTLIHPDQVAGNTITGTDSSGNPIYAYNPPPQTSTDDPNNAFWLYAGDGHHYGTGDLKAVKLDVQYDFAGDGWFKSVKFGGRRQIRSQVNKEAGVNWSGIAPAWMGTKLGLFATEKTPAYTTVDFADFYRGGVLQGPNTKFLTIRPDLLMDPVKLAAYVASEPTFINADGTTKTGYHPQLDANGNPVFDPANVSTVREASDDVYLMFNYGKEFDNGMALSGNFGVRYTQTVLDSEGFLAYTPFAQDQQTPATTTTTVGGTTVTTTTRTPTAEQHDAAQDYLPQTAAFLCPSLLTTPLSAADIAAGYTAATAISRACPASITVGHSDPQTVHVANKQILPSFNLKWDLNSEMLVRFAVSKNMARPNIQDMRAGQTISAITSNTPYPTITDKTDPLYGIDRGYQSLSLNQLRVTGGNPYLKPTLADNYDVSWEWYFKGGMLSTAFFKKNLSNIIESGTMQLGTKQLDGQTVAVTYGGNVNQAKAKLQGMELAYQQFYDFLPGPLSHLGLQTNFTYIESSATPPPPYTDANGDGVPDDPQTIYRFGVKNLLGQSKYIFNIVGIYQDQKWEGRVAYNWRSENLTTYHDYITGDPVFLSDVGFLDASLKYNVNRQWQVSLNASNLLDTKSKATAQIDAKGTRVDRFSFINDRRFVFDVRYQY